MIIFLNRLSSFIPYRERGYYCEKMLFKSNHWQRQIRENEIKWMRQWETIVKNCKIKKYLIYCTHTHNWPSPEWFKFWIWLLETAAEPITSQSNAKLIKSNPRLCSTICWKLLKKSNGRSSNYDTIRGNLLFRIRNKIKIL